jgi:hypothetical protein
LWYLSSWKRARLRQLRHRQVKQTRNEKWRDTEHWKKHETFVEQRAAELISPGILRSFGLRAHRCAGDYADESERNQNKIKPQLCELGN